MKTKLITRIERLERNIPQDTSHGDYTKAANHLSRVYGNREEYTQVTRKEFMARAEEALRRVYETDPSIESGDEGEGLKN